MKKFIVSLFLITVFSILVVAQTPTETTTKAAKLMSGGDILGAIAVLDKAIVKRKDLFEAYKMRSFLRSMKGDFAGSLDDISNAIKIKSDDGSLYEQRAFMRLRMNADVSLILKDLDLAIANGKNIERVYTLRATVHRQSGNSEAAIADYQTAIGLNPNLAQAYVGLASIYMQNNDDAKAISILETYLNNYENSLIKSPAINGKIIARSDIPLPKDKNNPNAPDGVQTIIISGNELSAMPSPDLADAMTARLEQTKNTSLAYSNLALLYKTRGDYEKALQTVEKGIKLDNTDTYPISVRGQIKSAQKNYEGALIDFNLAIQRSPRDAFTYLERGLTFYLLDRNTDAQKDFDKYLQLYPNGKSVLETRLIKAKKNVD